MMNLKDLRSCDIIDNKNVYKLFRGENIRCHQILTKIRG